jgi:hypothetical protein
MAEKKTIYPKIAGILMIINACVFFGLGIITFLVVGYNLGSSPHKIFAYILPSVFTFFIFLIFALNLKAGISFWKNKYSFLSLLGIAFAILYCFILHMMTAYPEELIILIISISALIFATISKIKKITQQENICTSLQLIQ